MTFNETERTKPTSAPDARPVSDPNPDTGRALRGATSADYARAFNRALRKFWEEEWRGSTVNYGEIQRQIRAKL